MQQMEPSLVLPLIAGAIALIVVVIAVRISRRQAAARTEALRRQSLLMEKKRWVVESDAGGVFSCRPGQLIEPQDLLKAQEEFRRLIDAMTADLH